MTTEEQISADLAALARRCEQHAAQVRRESSDDERAAELADIAACAEYIADRADRIGAASFSVDRLRHMAAEYAGLAARIRVRDRPRLRLVHSA
jgi:hypothetical protein